MTVVKYDFEAWALRKVYEYLKDVFQRNCLRIVLGNRPTNCISNNRLYEKCYSIQPSTAIMKKRLRWQGRVLQIRLTDCRRLSFSANHLEHTESRSSSSGVRGCHKERFKRNGNFLGECKEGGLIDWEGGVTA